MSLFIICTDINYTNIDEMHETQLEYKVNAHALTRLKIIRMLSLLLSVFKACYALNPFYSP